MSLTGQRWLCSCVGLHSCRVGVSMQTSSVGMEPMLLLKLKLNLKLRI